MIYTATLPSHLQYSWVASKTTQLTPFRHPFLLLWKFLFKICRVAPVPVQKMSPRHIGSSNNCYSSQRVQNRVMHFHKCRTRASRAQEHLNQRPFSVSDVLLSLLEWPWFTFEYILLASDINIVSSNTWIYFAVLWASCSAFYHNQILWLLLEKLHSFILISLEKLTHNPKLPCARYCKTSTLQLTCVVCFPHCLCISVHILERQNWYVVSNKAQ